MNDLEKKSANLESEGKKWVDGGKQEEIAKTINANAKWRDKVDEFLIHNYKINGKK